MANSFNHSASLLSLGPDALGFVVDFLDAYDLAYIWLCGSKMLHNILSSRVRSFQLAFHPSKLNTWPNLVSHFPNLHSFSFASAISGYLPEIENVDLRLISSEVRHLTLFWSTSEGSFNSCQDHFTRLESLQLCHKFSSSLASLQKEVKVPRSLTKLTLDMACQRRLDISTLPPGLTSLTGGFAHIVLLPDDLFPESLTCLNISSPSLPPNFISKLPPQLTDLKLDVFGLANISLLLEPLPLGLRSFQLGTVSVSDYLPLMAEISQNCLNLVEWNLNVVEHISISDLFTFLPKTVTKVGGRWTSDIVDAQLAALLPRQLIEFGDAAFTLDALPYLPPGLEFFNGDWDIPMDVVVPSITQPLRTVLLQTLDQNIASKLPIQLTSLRLREDIDYGDIDLSHLINLTELITDDGSIQGSKNEILFPPQIQTFRIAEPFDFSSATFVMPIPPSIHFFPSSLTDLTLPCLDISKTTLPSSLVHLRLGVPTADHNDIARLPKSLLTLQLNIIEVNWTNDWSQFFWSLPRLITDMVFEIRSAYLSWETELDTEDLEGLPRGLLSLSVPKSAAFNSSCLDFLPETLNFVLVDQLQPKWWRQELKRRAKQAVMKQ